MDGADGDSVLIKMIMVMVMFMIKMIMEMVMFIIKMINEASLISNSD